MDEQQLEARRRAYLSNVNQMIAKYGWIVQGVFPTTDDPGPSFAYTVGLAGQKLPELITFGLSATIAQEILNDLAQRQVDGVVFRLNTTYHDVVVDYPACFVEVIDSRDYLTMSNLLYGMEQPVRALQVAYPDQHGRWPWQAGSTLAKLPLLGVPRVQ